VIVLGPGSLYTSVIPNLLVAGVAREIERARAVKLYVANLMTQPGETDGFTLRDHLKALNDYLDVRALDAVIANVQPVPEELLERFGLRVVKEKLLDVVEIDGVPTVKHHPERLARTILRCARELYHERFERF